MSPRTPSAEFQAGVRAAIAWLHARALQMNDPHAQAVLNSAAFDLGGSERITFSSAKQVEGESSRADPLPDQKEGANSLISRRPDIQFGSPCIRGTRIPVRAIKSFANAGYSPADTIREYPGLTPEQIEAAVRYGLRQPKSPG